MFPSLPNSSAVKKPKLLERVRIALCTRHYSRRTEEAYVNWIKRFILFHHKRHPAEMGEKEVREFLNHLAVREKVAASLPEHLIDPLKAHIQKVRLRYSYNTGGIKI